MCFFLYKYYFKKNKMNNIHACQTKKRQRTVDVDDLAELFSCCDFFYTPPRSLLVDPFSINLLIIVFVNIIFNQLHDQIRAYKKSKR